MIILCKTVIKNIYLMMSINKNRRKKLKKKFNDGF